MAARKGDLSAAVPWSGFDLINAFNRWKTSEGAGRVFVVAPDGSTTKQVTGLSWRREVSAQVFEEAAVDLGRGLARYAQAGGGSASRDVSAKDGIARAFVSGTRGIPAAVTVSAWGKVIPGRLRCRGSGRFGCMMTPGGCGGCSALSSSTTRGSVQPSCDLVPESCPRLSPDESIDGMCA
jgi:hypothetical protein